MIKEIIGDSSDVLEVQVDCLVRLKLFFQDIEVQSLQVDNFYYTGVRGKYYEQTQYCLHFCFNSINYNFEFYLHYDQLEFYITKNHKIIKKCILEDFWEPEVMVTKFFDYLQRCVDKLK